jgi:hypothetical protein
MKMKDLKRAESFTLIDKAGRQFYVGDADILRELVAKAPGGILREVADTVQQPEQSGFFMRFYDVERTKQLDDFGREVAAKHSVSVTRVPLTQSSNHSGFDPDRSWQLEFSGSKAAINALQNDAAIRNQYMTLATVVKGATFLAKKPGDPVFTK